MIYKFLKVILIYFVISINFVLANEINNLNVSGNQRISKETIKFLELLNSIKNIQVKILIKF